MQHQHDRPALQKRHGHHNRTVIPQGLALTPDFMAEHDLTPGASVVVTVGEVPRKVPIHITQLIRETRGMFASHGGGMAEDLMKQRREDERRFKRNGDLCLRCQRSATLS